MRKFYTLLLLVMLLPVMAFAQAPAYCTPSGNNYSNNYLTAITSSDATADINYTANSHPGGTYLVLPNTIQAYPGATFTVNLVAKSLGGYSTSNVYEDIRYCHASMFLDFDRDGDFGGATQTWGNKPPEHNVGGNYNQCMNITARITVPSDAPEGISHIRVIYTNAWGDWPTSCTTSLDKGIAYDIPVEVLAPLSEYTVNIASANPEAGSVAFTNPASSGNSLTTTDPSVTVTATANTGWRFTNWTDASSNIVSTDASYTYTGAADVSLTANFEVIPTFTVTINQPDPAKGSISVTAGGNALTSGASVYEGTVLTLSNTPVLGWHLDYYIVDGVNTTATEFTVTGNTVISAEFAEGVEYCEPTGVPGRTREDNVTNWSDPNVADDKRSVSSLTVTDGVNTTTVEGCENVMPRAVYFDRSSTVFTTTPGSTVSVTVNVPYQSGWMHTYVYVDDDLNGLDVDDKVWDNDNGGHQPWAVTFEIPVPADMNLGDYRVRYIVDWDQNMGPCYYGQSGSDNGEIVIDFTLRVAVPHVPTINYTVSGGGDVVVADEFTHEGTDGFRVQSVVENGSEIEKEMLLIFVPKQYKGEVNTIAAASINGTDIRGLLVSGTYLDYESKDLAGTSDAACYWMTIPATQTEDQNVSVTFEGAVQGIDGIGMEESNGPAEYYNINGVRVSSENLAPGFYIVRQGGKATKVFIQK